MRKHLAPDIRPEHTLVPNLWLVAVAAICLEFVSCTSGGFRNPNAGSGTETIAATSGTPQSHGISGVFAAPLVATVMMGGAPISGATVNFTAPNTGASGTFANTGTAFTTVTTDVNGSATSATFTANSTAGSYTVVASIAGGSGSTSFSLTNTTGSPSTVQITSGGSQSVGISLAFAPLTVTVLDSGQNPVQNAVVTFQAPGTGASGTFANSGTNTTTATANASGLAIASPYTANTIAGADVVTATVAGVSVPATFALTNLAGPPATIVATTGTPQSTVISTPFASNLAATVLDNYSNPISGVQVTFSAPTTSASGTFSNGLTTEVDVTNASGVATATVFTANGRTGGPYTVTASAAGVSSPANFFLINTLPFKTYVFYLSGQEASTAVYSLAGSVRIDSDGNVLAGEQDYNDGSFGITSPEPSGDTITGGTLSVGAKTGQGTLTLVTSNGSVGVGGTETLGVQFVNLSHALIIQFDGTATSSGSMDIQTLPPSLNGGYAFTLAGVDPNSTPVAFGGVFAISGGTNMQNGVLDTNDAGTVTTDAPLSGTLSAFDSFGRGSITSTINYSQLVGSPAPVALNYYVVGPEALRLIDVDSVNNGGVTSDTAVGSAYGQGANATTASNSSLGASAFGLSGNSLNAFATAGMFTPESSSATLSGVADDDELTTGVGPVPDAPITGTYSIAANGYGSLSINSGNLGDVATLGVYVTDPKLNLLDPNNTTTGEGGAVLAEMDPSLSGGTGLLLPQTNTSTANFKGKYAFGAQAFNTNPAEFDLLGGGSVSKGVLAGTGLASDPFTALGGNTTDSKVEFSGKPLADTANPGRYTLSSSNSTPNPLEITLDGTTLDFDLAIYQASGGQLLWINEDSTSAFLGSLQQESSLVGLPAVKVTTKPQISLEQQTPAKTHDMNLKNAPPGFD
jgi:hypothetical protein